MTRAVAAPTSVDWFAQDGRGHRTAPLRSTRAFHERLPGYAPSPLIPAESLATDLGLGELWIKDESDRYGLPSFKILGASWATYRALQDRGAFDDGDWSTVADLARLVGERTSVRRLVAATDGNHGRAVVQMATWLGLESAIFVPTGTTKARIEAMADQGATVEVVDGGYEAAVMRSAKEASADSVVVSDTSWEGYVDIPAAVVEGYSTIFDEAQAQAGGSAFDAVVVQVGVGALAGAAVRQYRSGPGGPRLVAVEPLAAACNLMSARLGERVSIPGPHASIMAGLNCDTPSLVAWPDVAAGFDLFLAIGDDDARAAMRRLAGVGVVSGETGAAGLAGLTVICRGGAGESADHLGLGPDSRVLVISTEGATDPDLYESIVGSKNTEGGASR